MTVPAVVLDILACPKCQGPVTLADTGQVVQCPLCKIDYPVRDGIPIMLVDAGRSTP